MFSCCFDDVTFSLSVSICCFDDCTFSSACSVVVAGTASDNKQLNRVEAQSPSQSNQQQSTHNAPQQTLPFNIHYGYYYPGAVLPGAASFQYPTMFPVRMNRLHFISQLITELFRKLACTVNVDVWVGVWVG